MWIPTHQRRDIKFNLLWQTLLVVLFMSVVLFAFNEATNSSVLWAVGTSSLASSAYIVFAMPQSIAARSHRVIGGYVVAIGVGIVFHQILYALFQVFSSHFFFQEHPHTFWISASIGVGISMLLMVLLGFQHPPAAGIALVLVLGTHDFKVLTVIIIAVGVLAILRKLLSPYLKNLVE